MTRLVPVSEAHTDFCWYLYQQHTDAWWWSASGNLADFRTLLWRDVLEMRAVVSGDDRLVGLAVIYRANLVHGTARLAVYLDADQRMTGWPLQTVAALIDEVFRRYPIRKLSMDVVDGVTVVDTGVGSDVLPVVVEGLLRAHVRFAGEQRDVAVLAIFANDWHEFRRRDRDAQASAREVVASVLGCAPSQIGLDTPIADLEGVDSLVMVIVLEELALTPHSVNGLDGLCTVRRLQQLVDERAVEHAVASIGGLSDWAERGR